MKIKEEVLNVLSFCKIEDAKVQIQGQLDRSLYVAVNKVLEAAGGKWNRKAKSHVFEGNPVEILENIILTGEITTKQDIDFFPTPDNIIEQMLNLADIKDGDIVLEPSMGDGAIIKRLVDKFKGVIIGVEKDSLLKDAFLSDTAFRIKISDTLQKYWATPDHSRLHHMDFLKFTNSELAPEGFDKVIMNPPFSKQQDIDHVLHAYSLLKEKGVLVSVMSTSFTFRTNKKSVEFKEFLESIKADVIALPQGSFKKSGTMVNTVLVVIKK